MPDFEIRYFHADGSLAVIQMSVQQSREKALEFARLNQDDFARFELRHGDGSALWPRRSGLSEGNQARWSYAGDRHCAAKPRATDKGEQSGP